MKTGDKRKKINGMTQSELAVFKTMTSWTDAEVQKTGWPDFFVKCGDSFYCVEVKAGSDPVSKEQQKMHRMLAAAGIMTLIVRDGWCEQTKTWFV